jgi:hypothetical protein
VSHGQKISVAISDSLRSALAESCEKSGRSLTAEVEARLRHSLDMPGSDRMLLLRFDDGLWAWLHAYERGVSLWGNLHDTAIAMIRSQIHNFEPNDTRPGRWRRQVEMMGPYLPARIQEAIGYNQPS